MEDWQSRTRMLLGEESIQALNRSEITVFGLGGVGGVVVESLARAGVGKFNLVDFDVVSVTNKNRQLIATDATIGQKKTTAVTDRIKLINKNLIVRCHDEFVTKDNADKFITGNESFVIDCVDNVTAKIAVIEYSVKNGINIISSMGTGNKTDPFRFKISDISKTSVCPLAKVMRKELKERGINNVDVIWSDETPVKPVCSEYSDGARLPPASISFMPPVAGFMIASYVIKKIICRS